MVVGEENKISHVVIRDDRKRTYADVTHGNIAHE